ncbi:MAG TPA: hypothetical protein VJZ27_04120, partial [Aggregatilineales bacterium]|nr:hypothetical protein [Aggregatilineales bacterium]
MKANHSDKVHRRLLSLCLVSLLAGVYLLTYRGFPVSIDELSLFSTTESLVKYRELQIVSLYHEYPIITNLYTDTPWQGTLHEPLQIFLTAPFYWIAQHIDGIGLLHTVWTFNVVVVMLIALIIYRGGVAMGYSDAAAWITAVMTAFGTMLWHYSQTFFREPLAGLLLLITFVLAYQIQRNRAQLLLAWMLLAFIGAVLTKAAALLTLPALIFILLPDFSRRDQSRLWRVMLAIMILLILAFAVGGIIPNDRFDIGHYVSRLGTSDTGYIRAVVGAYLFSPGRSIWATCPILLLAFVGAWMAYRDGKRR